MPLFLLVARCRPDTGSMAQNLAPSNGKSRRLTKSPGTRSSVLSSPPFVQDAAVTLADPGSGTVTLSMFELAGTTNASDLGTAGQALAGGGFSEVRVLHCELVAISWLLLPQSNFLGGAGTCYAPPNGPFTVPSGGDGVHAPSTSVAVEGSSVRGGDGMDVIYDATLYSPTSCVDVSGAGEGLW